MNQRKVDELNRITRSNPEDYEDKPDMFRIPKRIGATALILFAVVGGIYAGQSDSKPKFSSETQVVKIEKGDTVWGAASEIDGVESLPDKHIAVDYIENMPENADTLKDGLQSGERLNVPENVSR